MGDLQSVLPGAGEGERLAIDAEIGLALFVSREHKSPAIGPDLNIPCRLSEIAGKGFNDRDLPIAKQAAVGWDNLRGSAWNKKTQRRKN